MTNLLNRLIGDKKEWKRMEARARALPRDYRVVYDAMKQYMWRFTSGDGMDIVEILKDVLEQFEAAAAEGKGALEVTGDDVAAYCDDLLRGTRSFADRWRESLNQKVHQQLGDEGEQ
jgi:DNA-binding ferritin-like protein (Dps family)